MRTINKSRNLVAYALLATLAFTGIFMISTPSPAIADGGGTDPIGVDTVPVGGGGGSDTSGGSRSLDSNFDSPSTLDLILLILESAIF
jgi:hypothetical protein